MKKGAHLAYLFIILTSIIISTNSDCLLFCWYKTGEIVCSVVQEGDEGGSERGRHVVCVEGCNTCTVGRGDQGMGTNSNPQQGRHSIEVTKVKE